MFFHPRAQLESGSKLLLVILSTMILDNLENIKLRKEKSPRVKRHFGA